MNYNNLAQKTNFTAGTERFKNVPFFINSVNLPGINISRPKTGKRFGSGIVVGGDSIEFNDLTFDMLIDENYVIYQELMKEIFKSVNVEESTFKNDPFMFWLEINDNDSNKLFKIEFYNCGIESISDIFYFTNNDEKTALISVSLSYSHFSIIEDSDSIPTMQF